MVTSQSKLLVHEEMPVYLLSGFNKMDRLSGDMKFLITMSTAFLPVVTFISTPVTSVAKSVTAVLGRLFPINYPCSSIISVSSCGSCRCFYSRQCFRALRNKASLHSNAFKGRCLFKAEIARSVAISASYVLYLFSRFDGLFEERRFKF